RGPAFSPANNRCACPRGAAGPGRHGEDGPGGSKCATARGGGFPAIRRRKAPPPPAARECAGGWDRAGSAKARDTCFLTSHYIHVSRCVNGFRLNNGLVESTQGTGFLLEKK